MKHNFATLIITLIVLVFVLITAGMAYSHVHLVRRMQMLQAQMNLANRNLAIMNNLGNEARAYGEKHPAIRDIIQKAMGPRGANSSTNASAVPGKTPAK